MILYMLEWDNGLDYADHVDYPLGTYSSKKNRDDAKVRYCQAEYQDQWPFCSGTDGKFLEWEINLDEDLLSKSGVS